MKHAVLGLRIFAVLLLAVAPALVAVAAGWAGAYTAALFAVAGAAAGTVAGGLRFGVIVSVTIAVAAVVAMPLGADPLAVAAVMTVLGGIYGFWAAAGYTSAATLIPAFVPYLVRDPPGIFSTAAPTLNAAYLAAFFVVFVVSGTWAALVMSKLILKGHTYAGPSLPRRPAVMFGLFLGAIAGAVIAIALDVAPDTHWAWITLTMFILANPSGKINGKQVRDRVAGTVIGFALALLLSALPLDTAVTALLALVLITVGLVVRIEKKPYWFSVMISTPAVILIDSVRSDPEKVAEQRLLFTLLGAGLVIVVALLANLMWSVYLRHRPQASQANTAATATADTAAN